MKNRQHRHLPDSSGNYLLDQQLKGLEKAFLQDWGLRERMTRAR